MTQNFKKSDNRKYKYLGKKRSIIDGPEKLMGKAQYAGDLNFPGMMHVRLVLSQYAHAKVVNVSKVEALKIPGVKAVYTAEDLTCWKKISASRTGALLARDETVFVGHPIAAIVGSSPEAAMDGASCVEVTYEQLPVVSDIEMALQKDASLVWQSGIPRDESDVSGDHAEVEHNDDKNEDLPNNVHSQNFTSYGDVDKAMSQADVVIERIYNTNVVHQGYLEPQNCVVVPDPMEGLTIYTSTQGPKSVHKDVARLLDLSHSSIKVVPMTIGGGFGGKHGLLEPTASAIALELNLPVKLELSRSEDFLTSTPAPACKVRLKMGAMKDGTLCALDATIDVDNGVYAAAWWSSLLALLMASGYKILNYRIQGREVVTHKVMAGAYRAPTAQTASFVIESHMDQLAMELNLDKLDFRIKNAAQGGDRMVNGKPWPSLGLSECLKALKHHPSWVNRKTEENEGWGMAIGLWPSGVSPASAICKILADGSVQVQVGSVDISGINSGFVQIVSEVLSIDPSQVEIIQLDSKMSPAAPPSGGSQVTYSVAGPIRKASEIVKDQLADFAAEHFEASKEDLVFENGSIHVSGNPNQSVSLGNLAKKAEGEKGGNGPIIASASESLHNNAPAASVHAVRVKVDVETGVVTPLQYIAIQDVGFAINPMLIEGQMHGGVLQGLGWALWEEMPFDQHGQPLATNFMDYPIPRSQDGFHLECVLIENPSPEGPYGIRGVGEPPIVPGAAAVANAVSEATGIRCNTLPIRSQDLWSSI